MHETQNNEKGKEQMDSWSSQKKKKKGRVGLTLFFERMSTYGFCF